MAFLTATQIHNGYKWLPQGTVIEVADDGTIIALHDGYTGADVTHYDGVLAPGFVNTHCHLELSHMKDVIPEHTGLIPFLKTIPQHRNDHTEEQKKTARHAAYDELVNNGVVAVGDIANTTDALDLRARGGLHFYTFIESLGFTVANADKMFAYATQAFDAYNVQRTNSKLLKQAIVPHAPYSVSSVLFGLIDRHQPGAVLSIHNQESPVEDEYYRYKTGGVQELLHTLGVDDSQFVPSGKSSLQTYLEWLSPTHPFLFIHNTCTTREDIQFAKQYTKDPYWCFCPNANLYIENRLPDVNLFINEGCNICVGTDSLASNYSLSILSELQALKTAYPTLSWETLLQWGTRNGAQALGMQDVIGSIAPGKKPGIIHIADWERGEVTRLI